MKISKYIMPYAGLILVFGLGYFSSLRNLSLFILLASTGLYISFLLIDFLKKRIQYFMPSIGKILFEFLISVNIIWMGSYLFDMHENIIMYVFIFCHLIKQIYIETPNEVNR